MSTATTYRWDGEALTARDDCDVHPARVEVADSWLVEDGAVLALELHRSRFRAGLGDERAARLGADPFWDAAIAAIPRSGAWFPRVELRDGARGAELLFRLRTAPERRRSLALVTHRGPDPRTRPRVKGPDLPAMLSLRTGAQAHGADEAVLLSPEGWVADGTTTTIAWWRGDAFCVPDPGIPRIDGVTVRAVLALAQGLGVDVLHERDAPAALDGLEVWALNALHGIRIVTSWADGPAVAERPGRLERWRTLLGSLRRSLPVVSAT